MFIAANYNANVSFVFPEKYSNRNGKGVQKSCQVQQFGQERKKEDTGPSPQNPTIQDDECHG